MNTVEQLGVESIDVIVNFLIRRLAPADAGFFFVICNLGRSYGHFWSR